MTTATRENTRVSVSGISLRFVAVAAVIGLSGCAHFTRPSAANDNGAAAATSDGASAATAAEQQALKEGSPTIADLNDSGSDLQAIPFAVNRQVLQWIDYFQGRGRPHMERYLSRSTRYMPVMKAILREQGLPEDLIYIALIESGFSATAHSSASAVGYWQFIRGTGKRYGLRIDSYVDDRRDFIKATYAAADYFKGLYNLFGAWYLAIASYNVGENRVKNLIMKYHTRDFWQLARENKLPQETINYVPKFIAARLIAKEPEKYGFTDIEYMPPLSFAEVEFETSIDIRKLAKEMALEYDDLRDLNPAYKRGVAFERGGKLKLRVPVGSESAALAAAAASVAESKQRYVADEDYGYYKIRRGDTIASIARKFGTSQRSIRSLNKLTSGARLVAGRRLRVPGENIGGLAQDSDRKADRNRDGGQEEAQKKAPSSAPSLAVGYREAAELLARAPSAQAQEAKRKPNNGRVHVVRKGETLIEIARRYGVSLRQLTQVNRISRRAMISIGTRLEIP